MAEGNNNSTYELSIKKSFEDAVIKKGNNDEMAGNIKYKNERLKAENFLLEKCKNLPEEQKNLLIKKIAEKIVYFEAAKSKIEEECSDALEELKDTIFIQDEIEEYGLIKAGDLIKNNEFTIRSSNECLKKITEQIKKENPEIYKIFLTSERYSDDYNKLINDKGGFTEYSLYSFAIFYINIVKEGKLNEFIKLNSYIESGNSNGALNIIKGNFVGDKYLALYDFKKIVDVSVIEKKGELDEIKNIIKIDNKGIDIEILDATIKFCVVNIPKEKLHTLINFIRENKTAPAKEIFPKLISLGIDYYDIGNFYSLLYSSYSENKELRENYKTISYDAKKQTKLDKDIITNKSDKKINKNLMLIFGEDLGTEKEKQLNGLMDKFIINGEIHGVLEFKKGLKEIFKGTEFENKIDSMKAGDFLQIIIDYNEKKIAKNVENMKSSGFNDEKFNNLSKKEINEILELNNLGKIGQVIEKLILLGIINKPNNTEELNIIKSNLNEYLNKTNQNRVFKKNLENPERLNLLQDILDGKIIEGSLEHSQRLNKIQKNEKKEESSSNTDGKNILSNQNKDIISSESISKMSIGHIHTLPNGDQIQRIDKENCKIVFGLDQNEVICKPKEVRNILSTGHYFESLGLGFVINDFAQDKGDLRGELIDKIASKDSSTNFDIKDGLSTKEIISILNILGSTIFGDEFKNTSDIRQLENFYKLRNNFHGEGSLLAKLTDERGIIQNGKYNKTNLLKLI